VQHSCAWRPTTSPSALDGLLRGRQQRRLLAILKCDKSKPAGAVSRTTAQRTACSFLPTVWRSARRWRCSPQGWPGSPFCRSGDSLGVCWIFQKTLSPPLRTCARKPVDLNSNLVTISAGMLNDQEHAAEAWELGRIRLLKRRLPAQQPPRVQLSARLHSPESFRDSVSLRRSCVAACQALARKRLAIGHYSFSGKIHHPSGCSGRSPTLGRTPRDYPSAAMASSDRGGWGCSTCSPPQMAIQSGESTLATQEVQRSLEFRRQLRLRRPRRNWMRLHADHSLAIPSAIVGRPARARSTCEVACCGSIEVDQGEILLDGLPIRDLRLDDLRGRSDW